MAFSDAAMAMRGLSGCRGCVARQDLLVAEDIDEFLEGYKNQ